MRLFADCREAGRELGAVLAETDWAAPVVIGLARGGVPVAYEVARTLGAPLRIQVVRKIGAPVKRGALPGGGSFLPGRAPRFAGPGPGARGSSGPRDAVTMRGDTGTAVSSDQHEHRRQAHGATEHWGNTSNGLAG